MSELLPCPHCGERVSLYVFKDPSSGLKTRWIARVFCTKCQLGTDIYRDTEEEATSELLKRWNTRHTRTCHNKSAEGALLLMCSHCGAFTRVTNACDDMRVRYCGWCGCEVDK